MKTNKSENCKFSDADIAGMIMDRSYMLTHNKEIRDKAKNFTREQILEIFRKSPIDINDVERVFDEMKLNFCRFISPGGEEIQFRFSTTLSLNE